MKPKYIKATLQKFIYEMISSWSLHILMNYVFSESEDILLSSFNRW